jgi:hypothetical protein
MGCFFALIQKYTGASQTRIGMACGGMQQGKISEIIRGNTEVKHLDKFEEIANGLKLPDSARITLGLAPCFDAYQQSRLRVQLAGYRHFWLTCNWP